MTVWISNHHRNRLVASLTATPHVTNTARINNAHIVKTATIILHLHLLGMIGTGVGASFYNLFLFYPLPALLSESVTEDLCCFQIKARKGVKTRVEKGEKRFTETVKGRKRPEKLRLDGGRNQNGRGNILWFFFY